MEIDPIMLARKDAVRPPSRLHTCASVRATPPPHHGSVANRSLPVGRSVRASNVRISVAPPTSKVTTMCPSATAVATMRAPLGRSAVTSAPAAPTLPSDLKTR